MPVNRLKIRQLPRFYQHQYYFLIKVALSLSLIVVALGAYSAYLVWDQPTVLYFATTTDGKIIELQRRP